jgi:hypothetical protein
MAIDTGTCICGLSQCVAGTRACEHFAALAIARACPVEIEEALKQDRPSAPVAVLRFATSGVSPVAPLSWFGTSAASLSRSRKARASDPRAHCPFPHVSRQSGWKSASAALSAEPRGEREGDVAGPGAAGGGCGSPGGYLWARARRRHRTRT